MHRQAERLQILFDKSTFVLSYDLMKPNLQTDPPSRPLRDFLTFRLARLTQALNAQATEVLQSAGAIGLTDWRVLAMIAGGGAASARDIVTLTGFDAAQVSRALRHLEDTGLVLTVRDSTDRRMRPVRLTARGQALYDRLVPMMQRRQEALLSALNPEERQAIFGIIDKLQDAAALRDF
jgi:DNA-binding MarR family transcriptional regulator